MLFYFVTIDDYLKDNMMFLPNTISCILMCSQKQNLIYKHLRFLILLNNIRTKKNLFLGLKYAVRKFPHGLITGTCPLSWTLSSVPATPTKKIKRTQSMDIPRHETPVGQSIANAARATPGPMVTFDNREQFSHQDVEELQTQLDTNLLPRDSGTRLSRAQTQSSKQSSRFSMVSERSNLSNVSDKPWKP
jgi:hypothetical protein